MIKKIITEPLVHFILIAAAFFAVFEQQNPGVASAPEVVSVSANRVEQLKARFVKIWQRNPSTTELEQLISAYVLDEIYTREARSAGLDYNDAVIRKRLRQKMEFMLQDMAELIEPTEQELADFYTENAHRYRTDSQYSFEQVYISYDAPDFSDRLGTEVARIGQGLRPQGQRSPLPAIYDRAQDYKLTRHFGSDFVTGLNSMPLNQWYGPLHSGVGAHFVRLTQRSDAQLPELATLKDKVIDDWRYQKNKTLKKEFEDKLVAGYRIDIEAGQSL